VFFKLIKMVWQTSITDVLNQWQQIGVFSYVLPFLLIFAVVFAIISKTKIGEGNKAVSAIIAMAVGLLSLQFDLVPTFFATIFPRVGVGIAIILAVIILLAVFYGGDVGHMKWVGYIAAIGVPIWALVNWDWFGWGDQFGIGFWIQENFWSLAIAAIVIFAIYFISKSPTAPGAKP